MEEEIDIDVKGVFDLYKGEIVKYLGQLRKTDPEPLLPYYMFPSIVELNNSSNFRHNGEIFELLSNYFLETLDYIIENHEQIDEDNLDGEWRKKGW